MPYDCQCSRAGAGRQKDAAAQEGNGLP